LSTPQSPSAFSTPRFLQRVRVGREHEREPADPGAGGGVAGQQRRMRVRLVQPLDDGERLDNGGAVVGHERGDQALRVDGQVARRPLVAAAQPTGDMVGREVL